MIAGFATFGSGVKAMIYALELQMWSGPISPTRVDAIANWAGPDPIGRVAIALGVLGVVLFGYGMWMAAEPTGRQSRRPQD
jgi:hypothetical protein